MSALIAGGYQATNDLDQIDVWTVDLAGGIFSDGFETGGAGAWSAVVP